jgi:hypothetical protein
VKAILALFLLAVSFASAQTATPPQAFAETTITFNLTPISLPGASTSVGGAETDALIALTPNNHIGETTLIDSGFTFIGGRYNRTFPSISTWLNNLSPNINGYQFQFGLTSSVGVVRVPGALNPSHWGERAGAFINYQINGTWGVGLEGQWCNFPGYAHNTYSLAFGPNFHF